MKVQIILYPVVAVFLLVLWLAASTSPAYALACASDGLSRVVPRTCSVMPGAASDPASSGAMSQRAEFDPVIRKVGALAPGALGLPGERLTWTISVTNAGTVPGTDIVITDTLQDAQRIDSIEVARGTFAVEGQTVRFSIPTLEPGELVQMQVHTTLTYAPADGRLVNEAWLHTAAGGSIEHASAELFVPASLPATGYEPQELPGERGPSVMVVALVSCALVTVTAWIVWRRGQ